MNDKTPNNIIRVWDIPTRLFHWSLVILISISLYTGFSGGFVEMDYHMLSGYSILTLVLFRLCWGVFGGHHSRFNNFVRGPITTLKYLKALKTERTPNTGHNPLGALSVIAMLLLLLVQAGTGLFANDDIMLEGPLVHLVSYDTSRYLTSIHKTSIWLVCGLIGLHILAVLFYQFYKRESLIKAMFTGNQLAASDTKAQPYKLTRELLLALITVAISASAVYVLVTYI